MTDAPIKPGDPCEHQGRAFICVQVIGANLVLRELRMGSDWLGDRQTVPASEVKNLPSKYLGGGV